MLGLMQSQPLLISGLIDFAERHHGDAEIVSRRVEGDIHRYTYKDSAMRARQVAREDLEKFDYILAMDMKNMTALHRLGEPDLWHKPRMLMSFSRLYADKQVDDPYSGGEEDFERVLDMIESATDGLLMTIKNKLQHVEAE